MVQDVELVVGFEARQQVTFVGWARAFSNKASV
jgi:hypothetical protein